MNRARTLWSVVAIVEALAIVLLSLQLLPRSRAEAAAAAVAPSPTSPGAPRGAAASRTDEGGTDSVTSPEESVSATAAAEVAPGMRPLVYGTIAVQGGGEPGSYVVVSLHSLDGERLRLVTTRNGEHRFAWADVAPGDYELHAVGEGVRDYASTITVHAGEVAHRVDIELVPTWNVRVRLLTTDGRPLADALAQVAKERPSLDLFAVVHVVALWQEFPRQLPATSLIRSPFTVADWSLGSGMGALPTGAGGDAGELAMPEDRPAHIAALLRNVVLSTAAIQPGQEQVELVVDVDRMIAQAATVRLRIVDAADGSPLVGAKVGINGSQRLSPPTPVDDQGRWQRSGVWPGRYRLMVQVEGRTLPASELLVPSGGVTDFGRIALRTSRELVIQVRGAGEGRLRGSLTSLDDGEVAGMVARPQHLAVRDGEIRAMVAEGRYRLQLGGAGGALCTLDTHELGGAPLVVDLQPEAEVHVDPSGLGGPTRFELRTASGVAVLNRWVTWRSLWTEKLLPGSYQMTVQPFGGAVRTEQVVVPSGGVRIEL